jgi:outer membrane protein assembly factor BamB
MPKEFLKMRRLTEIIICVVCVIAGTGAAKAQGRGPTDWMTSNGDAQRSAWVRADAKISRESMQKPGFKFLWKLKLKNGSKQSNSLTPPALLDLLIGYRGFRALAFVGGSADGVFVIDSDLGRLEWQKSLASGGGQGIPPQVAKAACPGGMTANITRPTGTAILSSPAGSGGQGGRRNPARSAVGEPGQGAVTLALVPPPAPRPPAPPRPRTPAPPAPSSNPLGAGPFLIYALSSDGMLHAMHLSNGANYQPPVKFLPPNANAYGLTVINNVAYVVTSHNCGGVPDGVWALDLATKEVTSWKADVSGSAGPAFGADGTIYITTGAGEETPASLVALEPGTLKVKGKYSAGSDEFTSSPVIFAYKGRVLIAAATRDGSVHLLDSSTLEDGADLKTPLYKTQAYSPTSPKGTDVAPRALSSWQSSDGTRWLLAPIAGPVTADAGFSPANGTVTKGAILTWKVVEQDGAPTLQPGWVSRDLASPLPPTIINGIVFAISSGEFRPNDSKITAAQRARRSTPAVLYALDGMTGKQLWSSGRTITSFVRGSALSGGGGQLYVGTYDGTLYAFGFPMEH